MSKCERFSGAVLFFEIIEAPKTRSRGVQPTTIYGTCESNSPSPNLTTSQPEIVGQYGDLSQGCVTAGAHYNPQAVDHPGHPGDLGNFVSEQGVIRKFMRLPEAKLFGGHSVLGRAVVVYEKEDDLGLGSDEESKLSGNTGERIACCVIGITSPRLWQETEPFPGEEVEEG
ncbi:hypothetical protein cypCar_00044715, partial [Cyprinus carpio]